MLGNSPLVLKPGDFPSLLFQVFRVVPGHGGDWLVSLDISTMKLGITVYRHDDLPNESRKATLALSEQLPQHPLFVSFAKR